MWSDSLIMSRYPQFPICKWPPTSRDFPLSLSIFPICKSPPMYVLSSSILSPDMLRSCFQLLSPIIPVLVKTKFLLLVTIDSVLYSVPVT